MTYDATARGRRHGPRASAAGPAPTARRSAPAPRRSTAHERPLSPGTPGDPGDGTEVNPLTKRIAGLAVAAAVATGLLAVPAQATCIDYARSLAECLDEDLDRILQQ